MGQSGYDTRQSGPQTQALNTYALLFTERVLNLHMIIKKIQGEKQIRNVADLYSHHPGNSHSWQMLWWFLNDSTLFKVYADPKTQGKKR